MSAPSPTPSNMPPPNLKRPRASAGGGAATPGAGAGSGPAPRTKRRKPEGSIDPETVGERGKSFGVGMVKGREEEWGEAGEVRTKIDFNELPVETLYRYLEFHDLLPRWDVSPWSEEPCTPPNQLYTLPPPQQPSQYPLYAQTPLSQDVREEPVDITPSASNQAPHPEASGFVPKQNGDVVMAGPDANQGEDMTSDVPTPTPTAHPDPAAVTNAGFQLDSDPSNPSNPTLSAPSISAAAEPAVAVEGETDMELSTEAEPPTTRSKTLPSRRPPTPTPPPAPQPTIKRGVITLSDVHAAREALAEKANAHWMKGLGGGQNKEGETIVNFLYKMKVGHGRLLRVYNPAPAPYPGL